MHIRFRWIVVAAFIGCSSAALEIDKPTFRLEEATIADVHAAYKSGSLTSVKLVQSCLDRIRAYEQATHHRRPPPTTPQLTAAPIHRSMSH